jgi:hypothetical protein
MENQDVVTEKMAGAPDAGVGFWPVQLRRKPGCEVQPRVGSRNGHLVFGLRLAMGIGVAIFLGVPSAVAQSGNPAESSTEKTDSVSPSATPSWFLGVLGRVNWIPPFIPQLFLDDSPAVVGPGFELIGTKRNASGMSLVFGLGYTSYAFEGPSRDKGDPVIDTEYIDSSLGLIHASFSMLWSSDIVPKQLAIEYGFGLDFGVIIGDMIRTEAYQNNTGWHPCSAYWYPDPMYCERPVSGAATDPYDQDGAHYHVAEKRIPPVMGFPHIPHLALRYTPDPKLAIKLELAYGIVQFWTGLSVHYGIN